MTTLPLTAQVNSSFTHFTPGDSCGSRSVQFDAAISTGDITEYLWKFTDASSGSSIGTATGDNAYRNFIDVGSYNVKLVVKDGLGNSDSSTALIRVYDPPKANFSVNALTGCAPHEVTFTDESIANDGAIVNWEWDYNDGQKDIFNTSTPATHSYSGLKKYSPTLIVTDDNGCRSSNSKRDFIEVYKEIEPVLTVTDNNSCSLPHTVTFTNNSEKSDFYTFVWDFGDGETLSNNQNINTHTYTYSGIFEVSLTAQSLDGQCSNTVVTNTNENVSIGIPLTDFILPNSVCRGEEFLLEAEKDASGLTNTGTWNFEDDNSEISGLEAKHVFNTPGQWDVHFVAYNSFSNCLSDTITKSLEVVPSPTVNFSADVSNACKLPVEVGFINNSSEAIRYEWDFKDGSSVLAVNSNDPVNHTYNSYGMYDVTLTGYNAEGCSSSVAIPAIEIIQPRVSINFNAIQFCESVPFNITAIVDTEEAITQYNFYFSDGSSFTSTSPTIAHQFNNEGNYNVQVSVETESGCSATSVLKEISVKEYCTFDDKDTSGNNNIGSVKISKPNKCVDKYRFVFEDTSNVTVQSWEFDDNIITGNTNPITYTFTEEDTSTSEYLVTMEGLDASNNPITRKFSVVVINEKSDYGPAVSQICQGDEVDFSPIDINPENIASYEWDFGDGSLPVTIENPNGTVSGEMTYQYQDTGVFHTSLKIIDKVGCSHYLTRANSVIVTSPTAYFDLDTNLFCSNDFQVVFTDESETNNAGQIVERNWDFGDGASLSVTDTFAVHDFTHDKPYRKYNVSLTIVNQSGCSSTYTKSIEAYKPKVKFASADTLVCGTFDVSLSNKSEARVSNNNQYTWDFGDGTTFNGRNAAHTFPDTGNYNVSLKVVDDAGCRDSVGIKDYIKLVQAVADFSISGDTTKCAGTFTLSMESTSLYASYYNWNFGDGTISESNSTQVSHVYEQGGIYEIVLVASGQGFCRDTARKNVRIKGPSGELIVKDNYLCLGGDSLNIRIEGKDIESYYWDLGDFSNTSAYRDIDSITHKYNNPGIYKPSVILLGAEDCQITLPGNEDKDLNIYVDELEAGDSLNIECTDPYIALEGVTALNIADNYYWSGPDTADYQNDNTYLDARVNSPGMYYLNTLDTLCNVKDSVWVTTSGIQPIGGAGPDLKIDCIDSTATLGGFTSTYNTEYLWKGPAGAFTSNDSLLLNPVVRDSGQYVLKITQKDCFLMDTLQVSLCSLLAVDTSLTFCANLSGIPFSYAGYDLYNLSTFVSGGINSYVSWYRDPEFKVPVENPSNAVLENNGDVYAKIVSLDGEETARAKTDLLIHSYVKADILREKDTICETYAPLYLDAKIFAGKDITYTWYYEGNKIPAFQETLSLNDPAERGHYVLEVSNPHCPVDYDTVDVMIYESPEVFFTEDDIGVIYETDGPLQLPLVINTGVRDSVTSISWDPIDYLQNANNGPQLQNVQNPIYIPQDDEFSTDYRAVVTTGYGNNACQVEAYVLVHNYKLINVPNSFSPNGDGLNETWEIDGLVRFPDTHIFIYNRWGKLIYENKTGYASPWDGSVNGTKVPFGTYYYVLDLRGSRDNIDFVKSGSLTVFR